MSKLYELIDNEIKEKGSSKKEILDYINKKHISNYGKEITSETKFISELVLKKIIKYRKEHPGSNYNKTIGLIVYKYVGELVTEIRDIKSNIFTRILFFFFKKRMVK